jgi:hypothetical protein
MTTDTRTEAQMQGNPGPTTIFHSDLPYIFVKERFTLDSYSTWGSTGGGRTFNLSQELLNYRSANPDLAYLMVVEESNGNQAIMNPMLIAEGWFKTNGSFFRRALTCINGVEYAFAFTSSDSQLSAITRDNTGFVFFGKATNEPLNYTFRPWGDGDTRVTLFRGPWGQHEFINDTSIFFDSYDLYFGGPSELVTDLGSDNNQAAKVHFIFLNIENTPTTFNRLPDKTGTDINIEIDNFNVGGVDMLANNPALARGIQNSGTTVTPIIGKPLGNKITGFSRSQVQLGFTTTSNVVTDNNTPILEIPNEYSAAQTMEIDFKDKYIKRNGNDVFTAASAAAGLRVIGTKEITFTPDSGGLVFQFTDTFRAQTYTESGSFSETPDANTIYLASTIYEGQKLLSSTVMTAGDNTIFTDLSYMEWFTFPVRQYQIALAWMITISNSGTITPRVQVKSGNHINDSVALSKTFGELKVRLIALAAN